MFFLTMIVFPILMTWLYGFITIGKYDHFKRKLDMTKEDAKDSLGAAAMWPLFLMVEPSAAKGLLFPTLYLWPRFREEYPEIKAREERDRKFKREIKVKQSERQRRENHGELRLADAQEEVKHTRRMALLHRETEEFQKQMVDDYPPELESGETYKKMKEKEAAEREKARMEDESMDTEFWCEKHGSGHWTTLRIARETRRSCS